jgi:hypothetical protein
MTSIPPSPLPVIRTERVNLLTTRWGDPLRSEAPPVDLLSIMFDEFSFVARKGGDNGLLFEFEFLHLEAEDDAARAAGFWGAVVANPTEDAVVGWVRNAFSYLPVEFPGLDAWVTVGGHVFNGRVALRVFVRQGSAYATQEACSAIGRSIRGRIAKLRG